jgi:glycosyltransferase involved in cell wall biosynthesis
VAIARALESYAPQVVHINMPGPYDGQNGLLAPVARMAGARAVVVTEHLPMVRRWWKRALVKRLAYRFVDAALTVAEANVPFLVDRQRVPKEKVRVVHNGLDERFGMAAAGRDGLREDIGVAAGRVVIAFVGNLLRHKGLHRVVRALLELGSDDWHLVIVGTGPEGERSRARLVREGLEGRATFLGRLSPRDVESVLSAVDVLALPSTIEGMPYVILEAMASGVPVVAGDVFGIPEMIDDGVHGFLVDPTDRSALSLALGRLVTDEALRRRMGAAARERFQREFTLSRQVRAVESVYLEALGLRSPGGER